MSAFTDIYNLINTRSQDFFKKLTRIQIIETPKNQFYCNGNQGYQMFNKNNIYEF